MNLRGISSEKVDMSVGKRDELYAGRGKGRDEGKRTKGEGKFNVRGKL